jgi:hypothetical protein
VSDAPNNPPAFDMGAFTAALSPENQALFADRKWADPNGPFDSYRNLEKLTGAGPDKLIRLPEKPEEFEAVYNKLGRPEKPELYGFDKVPEGFDPAKYDVEGAKAFAEAAHKAGLSPKQAEALRQLGLENIKANEARAAAARATARGESEKALQSEWGPKYEENVNLAESALDWLGLDDETRGALKASGLSHNVGIVKALAKLGAAVAEDKLVGTGATSFGNMTPALAQARLNALKADPAWAGRYMNGGAPEKEEFQRLVGIIASAGLAA